MCKCVRDADRLDSLKPNYTVNDISTNIGVNKSGVDLSCTRFKTRIRQSDGQVRLSLHISPAPFLICDSSDGNIICYHSTSGSRLTRAKSKDM